MFSNALIVLIVPLLAVVVAVAGDAPVEVREWRKHYDLVFASVPNSGAHDKEHAIKQVKKGLETLGRLVSSVSGRHDVDPSQIEAVKFWLGAANINEDKCRMWFELELTESYLKNFNENFSENPPSGPPSLLHYATSIRESLLKLCLNYQRDFVPKYLKSIPKQGLDLLYGFYDELRNSANSKKVAEYLGPFFPSPQPAPRSADMTAYLRAQTHKVYQQKLGTYCQAVMGVPKQVGYTLKYLEYKDSLRTVDQTAIRYFKARQVCTSLADTFKPGEVPQVIMQLFSGGGGQSHSGADNERRQEARRGGRKGLFGYFGKRRHN